MKSSVAEKVIRAVGAKPVADIHNWRKWWTTKLSLLAAALGGGALAFSALPAKWQDDFPSNLGVILGGTAVAIGILIPLVRGTEQPKLRDCDDGRP